MSNGPKEVVPKNTATPKQATQSVAELDFWKKKGLTIKVKAEEIISVSPLELSPRLGIPQFTANLGTL